jgi:phosphate transport system permease protein
MKKRPSAQPWTRQVESLRVPIIATSLAPVFIALATLILSGWDFSQILLGVFLPLQLIAGGFLGFRTFGKRGLKDAILMVFMVFLFAMVFVLLISVLVSLVTKGAQALSLHFIYENNRYVDTTTSLDYGGIGHAILGTIEIVGIATIISVPLGLLTAVYLRQSRGKHIAIVRTLVQSLSGLPSIVSGLFILAIMHFGNIQPSGFTGALALFPLMLPTVARVAEESLKLVPPELQMGALALGAPNYRAFFSVVLPAAKTGIVTAILLGVGRIIGETAPLLLTTIVSNTTNANPFNGPMTTLTTYVFTFLQANYSTSQLRAWGAALVLIILVAALFISARVFTRQKSSKPKRTK